MSRPWSMHPVWQLSLARVREFLREPEAVFWTYVFPLVMIIALGLAFRSEPVEAVAVIVEDGPFSADLVAALKASPSLTVSSGTADECRAQLRSGKSELIVIAEPPDILASAGSGASVSGAESPTASKSPQPPVEGKLLSDIVGTLRFVFDSTRPGSVRAREVANSVLQKAAGQIEPLSSVDVMITEPGSRYIDFLVPGLIGMGLMGGGIWGVGFAIVDMRIRQLLKRFLGTPMRKHHFIAAMMISRIIFMIPEILIVLLASRLLFGVVNHGSWLAVIVLITIGAFQFAGIGLLVASRAKTLEAVSGLMNLAMVPMWIGSGIFFSPDRFPDLVQPLIRILPLTPLISGMRRVMQDGAGLAQLGPHLVIISIWGIVTFVLALKRFRWE